MLKQTSDDTAQNDVNKVDVVLSPESFKSPISSSSNASTTPVISQSSSGIEDPIQRLSLSNLDSSHRSYSISSLSSSSSSSSTSLADKMLAVNLNPTLLISSDDLKIGKQIATGTYANVHEGQFYNQKVAIKKLKTYKDTHEEDINEALINEVKHTANLKHAHIITLLAICEPYCLVFEYMENGSLYDLLKDKKPYTAMPLLHINIALDIAKGLHFLHEHNVIHCDLKSSNVLLDGNIRAKLADFGLTQYKKSASSPVREELDDNGVCGTLSWMAPELLRNSDCSPDFLTDIYSFAWLLWTLLTHKTPFEELNPTKIEMYAKIVCIILEGQRGYVPTTKVPHKFVNLMLNCWDDKPKLRIQNMSLAIIELKTVREEMIKQSYQ